MRSVVTDARPTEETCRTSGEKGIAELLLIPLRNPPREHLLVTTNVVSENDAFGDVVAHEETLDCFWGGKRNSYFSLRKPVKTQGKTDLSGVLHRFPSYLLIITL